MIKRLCLIGAVELDNHWLVYRVGQVCHLGRCERGQLGSVVARGKGAVRLPLADW